MIKANIDAKIESLKHARELVRDEIISYDYRIDSLKREQKKLLEHDTDLCYQIEELEEMLNE